MTFINFENSNLKMLDPITMDHCILEALLHTIEWKITSLYFCQCTYWRSYCSKSIRKKFQKIWRQSKSDRMRFMTVKRSLPKYQKRHTLYLIFTFSYQTKGKWDLTETHFEFPPSEKILDGYTEVKFAGGFCF